MMKKMKERPKIIVGDKIVDDALEMLKAEADVDLRIGITQPELEEIIENYDALIVRSIPKVTEEVIKRGKRLKVVGRAGNGVDNINLDAATRQGIVVVNTPDSNSFSAGEQTIALMLASARNLPQAHQTIKNGGWGRSRFMGSELYGKTVGIVGLGRIGSFVATVNLLMCKLFGNRFCNFCRLQGKFGFFILQRSGRKNVQTYSKSKQLTSLFTPDASFSFLFFIILIFPAI
jgi:phosphoglycerate dehydrogenase-like enzyme